MFCDANLPLQAAHIAPFKFFNSDCDNEYNGIVLCANCHFIFDKYLILKKDGEQYRFYIKKSIDENVKRELNKKLQGYSEQVNSLVKKEPRYKQYFDKLVDLNRERYANI
jgi:predicted restriction endonuclease